MVRRIILDGYGYYVGKKGGMLIISRGGEKKSISVGNVSCIIANASGISFSGDALRLLLKHNIQLILLSGDRPIGKLQPMGKGGSVKLKKEQIKAQEDSRGDFIRWIIVVNKIRNQLNLLKRIRKIKMRINREISEKLGWYISKIMEISNYIENYGPSNNKQLYISKEAEASKYYWEALNLVIPSEVGYDGKRRKKYDNPEDPFNISLNYLYTILASEVWFAVELSGLDPYIGYLHEDSSRRPSLVMDLMEEFRQPTVDKTLINIFTTTNEWKTLLEPNKKLSEEGRRKLLKAFYEQLKTKTTFMDRSIPLSGHIHLQPHRLAKYIMKYTNTYQPYNII
ncbi:MAG: CRISPR-associated endonuclease Cas1 [Candidatus Methanomethylicia archaeon]